MITAPNPCQAQLVAVNQQKHRIDEIEAQIRRLRTELARAPAAQKAAIRADIAEIETQLPPLRTELQRLQGLLDRCYLRQSIAVPVSGGVLINA